MARSLVLGNGNMLVCLDEFAQVRDFYYPYVGLENHAGRELVHKIGVFADGQFSWLDSGEWEMSIAYRNETMASDIVATSKKLGLRLRFLDIVYNEINILLRNIEVEDILGSERAVKVFFNQQFHISENEHADTAYYNPSLEAVVHYKGRRVFLAGGRTRSSEAGPGKAFDDYSIGLFKIEGKEGSWRDAEDGTLSKNSIEHGSVDSTIGFTLKIAAGGAAGLAYWVCAGQTYKEVQSLERYVLAKTPGHLAETTQDFWHAWVNKMHFSFIGLDDATVRLFKNSLLIMRTHCDNRGGILASGDSSRFQNGRDTYAYIWPRDGAFAALALDKAGYPDLSERFFGFGNDIVTADGYVMHKYQPDKAFGSSWHPWVKDGKPQLAIQEDETAILIFAFWEHYKSAKDLEFVETIYNSFVKRCAEFLVSYREPSTGLPAPSYDLWEEKWGISTFSCSSVYGALIAASYFAALLGKDDDRARYAIEAERIKAALMEHLYDEGTGLFLKLVNVENGAMIRDATVDASSAYGVFKFGVLPHDDPRLVAAMKSAEEALARNVSAGGVARYDGDSYFKVSADAPGNPWFVTTLWNLQHQIALSGSKEDMERIADKLGWCARHALRSGILSEQLDPKTGAQLSASPLTWSHSEFVTTTIMYLEQLEKLGLGKVTYPVE